MSYLMSLVNKLLTLDLRDGNITPKFSEAEFHLKQGVADAIVVLKAEIASKNWRAAVALLKMVGFNVQKIINNEEDDKEVLFLQNLIKEYEQLSKERNTHTTNSEAI